MLRIKYFVYNVYIYKGMCGNDNSVDKRYCSLCIFMK